MSGIEEQADFGAFEGPGEIHNPAFQRTLVQIKTGDDLEPVRLQSRRHVGRIVSRVLQLAGVLVRGIADDQGDALPGLGRR